MRTLSAGGSGHRPDIALIDVQMPVLDGIEATRRIVEDDQLTGVHVVILTNYGLDGYIFRVLRAGASGFLPKETEPAELPQALRVVMRGDALLSPAVTRSLVSEFAARPPDALASAGPSWWSSPTSAGWCIHAPATTPMS